MNSLIETLNRSGEHLPDFAWPMLWQSSVLIAVLFVFDLAARRKLRASVRYGLWMVVLVKLLLPPTLAFPTSLAWWLRPPEASPKAQERTTPLVVTYGDPVPVNFPTKSPPIFVPPPKPTLSGAGRTAAMWAVVGLGLLAWLIVRWQKVAGDVRKATDVPASLTEVLDQTHHDIKLPRHVQVLVTSRAMSPAVCGLFCPVILLPQALVERLSPSQLRAVLLHELVHLRRGDVWVNCLQALLQIFYWWHPLLWLANAHIRRVREEAVDDAVMLALADDRDTYAPTLLEVAKLAFNRPLASLGLVGIMESRSALRQRIERLVEFRPPRKAGLTIASVLCVLAFAALAVPMEKAPATRVTQVSTQKQTESASTPPVELSKENEEVKLRMIVLNKPVARDATEIRKLAKEILAKIRGGTAFSKMASVYSEGRQGREGGDWGWVQKYDRDGALVLRKELADVAFSLKPGEASGVIETPEAIYLMLVEDKRRLPVREAHDNETERLRGQDSGTREIQPRMRNSLSVPNSDISTNLTFTSKGRQAILSKLEYIRLDTVLFHKLPLGEIVQSLSDESKKRDPEKKGINFMIDPNKVGTPVQAEHQVDPTTGLPVAAAEALTDIASLPVTIDPPLTDARLADVLNAIVKAVGNRIKYLIEDYAVVFSLRGPEMETLSVRTFQLDSKTLLKQLGVTVGFSVDQISQVTVNQGAWLLPGVDPQEVERIGNPRTLASDLPRTPERGGITFITRTNNMQLVSVALANFFSALGVDLASPNAITSGKSIFWSDRKGMLLVRATQKDLDAIGRALADFAAKPANGINAAKSSTSVATRVNQAMGPTNSKLEAITNKVPVLGDIPLIGKLFRSETNSLRAESPGVGGLRDPWGDPYITSSAAFRTSNSPAASTGGSGLAAGPAAPLKSPSSSEPLQTRVFNLDPNAFAKRVESVSPFARTNMNAALRDFFLGLGVDLSPPKSIFWNELSGGLLVRATAQDLDLIENGIEVLNRVPPRINIKAHFVEVEQGDIKVLGWDWYLGNVLLVKGSVTNSVGVLTDPQFRVVLRALEQRKGVDSLATPEVTTVSGRQAQIQLVDMKTIVTGINSQALISPGTVSTNGMTNSPYQTQTMPFGPVLDVIPYLAADGYTINMTIIPTVTEFLGYDDPAIYGFTNSTGQLPLPRFRVRQMTVTASVRDGRTLMLIGTVTTEILKKPDGSTETKDVSATQGKQLIVFVTATLVDDAGNRMHRDDESAPAPK